MRPEMREIDDDGHGRGRPGHGDETEDVVAVEPGDTAELTDNFDDAMLEIGGHQPGHSHAGATTSVEVA